VPEKFWDAEKGAIKTDDVLKSYTELEKAAGKPKYGVPGADADDATKAEFFKALGVPEKPEDYGLKPPEGLEPEVNDYMVETLNEYAKIAHDLKLSPAQAAGIQKWFDNMAVELQKADLKASGESKAAADKVLSDHFGKLFGDKSGEAVTRVKNSIVEAIPDVAVREALSKNLPDEALVAIAAIEQHYRKTYGQADQNIGGEGNPSGKSLEDLRKEATTLMSSPAYRDPMDKGHQKAKEDVANLYKQIGILTDAAKKK